MLEILGTFSKSKSRLLPGRVWESGATIHGLMLHEPWKYSEVCPLEVNKDRIHRCPIPYLILIRRKNKLVLIKKSIYKNHKNT